MHYIQALAAVAANPPPALVAAREAMKAVFIETEAAILVFQALAATDPRIAAWLAVAKVEPTSRVEWFLWTVAVSLEDDANNRVEFAIEVPESMRESDIGRVCADAYRRRRQAQVAEGYVAEQAAAILMMSAK